MENMKKLLNITISTPLDLSPLYNNILVSQCMILYFKVVIEITGWLRRRFGMIRYSKEFLQMFLAASIVFWPLFDASHWSWRLSALLPAVMLARLFHKGAIRKDPEDVEVQTFSPASAPSQLLFGPLQFSGIMIYISLYQFMSTEAVILASAIGIGDALAPMIGDFYGRHFYQVPLGLKKTMEGSVVGVFLGTVTAVYVFMSVLGLELLPLRVVLALGGIAAVVEGSAPVSLDNLAVMIAIHLSIDRVEKWLPDE